MSVIQITAFSAKSQIAIKVDTDRQVFICQACRLLPSGNDINLGDDPNGVEAHLDDHEKAFHTGAVEAKAKLEKFLAPEVKKGVIV